MRRGIIPAYAGCTLNVSAGYASAMDHPRIRGVHTTLKDAVPVASGSSPHTRGALGSRDGEVGALGIIPAYAGCTSWLFGLFWWFWDHPRIRGVHPGRMRGWIKDPGSSPHTRGARDLCRGARGPEGIIPAYAGCTTKCSWECS